MSPYQNKNITLWRDINQLNKDILFPYTIQQNHPDHDHDHHPFIVPVPLRMSHTAPMFALNFFLHSILFAGSTLASFQFLRSSLIVSLHVFLGLPHLRCPPTSSVTMLLIQPYSSQHDQTNAINYIIIMLVSC